MFAERRIAALTEQHAQLEGLLASDLSRPGAREEDRQRAKRRKLWIKDEVERLRRRRTALQ